MSERETPPQNIHEQTSNTESKEIETPESQTTYDIAREGMIFQLAQVYEKIIEDRRSGSKSPEQIEEELDQLDKLSIRLTDEKIEKLRFLLAKEIMGQDFMGPEEVEEAFHGRLEIDQAPRIPFSPDELERAKKLGYMLILRVGQRTDGKPLTMEGIKEILDDKWLFPSGDGDNPTCLTKEDFFTNPPVETRWALVSKEIIHDTLYKKCLEQVEVLIDELKKAFGGEKNLPPEYVEAIDEYRKEYDKIAQLVASKDDKKVAEATKKLAELKIIQILVPTAAEVTYDAALYRQKKEEWPFIGTGDYYIWTNQLSNTYPSFITLELDYRDSRRFRLITSYDADWSINDFGTIISRTI